jgi:FXSXX-COOH protein
VDGSAGNTTDDGATNGDGPPDWQSVIVDVSDLSLADLTIDDDSVLARSLRRLADDLAEPGRPIAGFNSAI